MNSAWYSYLSDFLLGMANFGILTFGGGTLGFSVVSSGGSSIFGVATGVAFRCDDALEACIESGSSGFSDSEGDFWALEDLDYLLSCLEEADAIFSTFEECDYLLSCLEPADDIFSTAEDRDYLLSGLEPAEGIFSAFEDLDYDYLLSGLEATDGVFSGFLALVATSTESRSRTGALVSPFWGVSSLSSYSSSL